MNRLGIFGVCALLALSLCGCAGTQSFSGAARAGDTVAVAVGWRQNLARDNITVRITTGSPMNRVTHALYEPNHPAVRAVINWYPDPLSSLLVSPQVGEDLTPSAQMYAGAVENGYTDGDKDWSQTVVFVDLPPDLPEGNAQIWVSGGGYEDPPASVVTILPGSGTPSSFMNQAGNLTTNQMDALARVGNHAVQFSGAQVPYAIQVDLAHNPDRDNGGAGKAHVVNTRGDLKSVAWHDQDSMLRVILTPAGSQPLSNLLDFKFHIAGGLTGLYVADVRAYDADGNTVPGISASLSGP